MPPRWGWRWIWHLVLQIFRANGAEMAGGPLAVVAAVGRPPHFFGKNDKCGFLPKAATPGWK